MSTLDLLIDAIKEKKQIFFEYNKPGKTPGVRFGNPYAVFIFTAKDGKKSTKVHLVQTSGVTDSVSNFPDFRQFNIEELSNVTILEDIFENIHASYNPEWDGYKDVIEKI